MDKRTKIVYGCTNYGPIDSVIHQNHLAVVANAARYFDMPYIGVTDKMYTHTASNTLASGSMEVCADYIFFTENDMLLPFDVIKRLYDSLVKTGWDGMAGLYFLRGDGTQPCLYNKAPDTDWGHYPVMLVPEDQIFTIDCAGMGCVLLKTDVFRKIPYPWFDLKEGSYGQDIYFYTKAKKSGVVIGCDSSVQCGHLGEKQVITIDSYRQWLVDAKDKNKTGFVLTAPRHQIKPEGILNVSEK
jgi:hypothetical protein